MRDRRLHEDRELGPCGHKTGQGEHLFVYSLIRNGDADASRSVIEAKQPALHAVTGLEPNRCARGYITFEMFGPPEVPTDVQMGLGGQAVRWAVPADGVSGPSLGEYSALMTVEAGQTVRVTGGASSGGIATMTVFAFTAPVPGEPSTPLLPGQAMGAADVEVCGGEKGAHVSHHSFGASYVNGIEAPGVVHPPGYAAQPELAESEPRSRGCRRGVVTFHGPKDQRAVAITFQFPSSQEVRWNLATTP